MLDFLTQHKKAVIASGICALILIIAVSVYFIVDNIMRSATVNVLVAPSIATVKIDGVKYGTYENIRIRPGEYAVEISAEGFKTKKGELKAVENGTTDIRIYLEPEEWNEDYYAENSADGLILGELKASEALKAVEKLMAENSFLNDLPIEIDYFTDNYADRITYTITYELKDNNTDFKIVIMDYTGGNYENALEKLQAKGADLEGREIEYRDLTSEMENGHAE